MPPTRDSFITPQDETLDKLACGDLFVYQKRRGYRFSLDAYLLAAFVDERPGMSVLEVGSGSGVIGIILAALKGQRVTAVEVQPEMVEMSRRSVRYNGLEGRIEIVEKNIGDYEAGPFDVVVSNPPYRPLETGRVSAGSSRAVARHELLLDLETLVARAARMLGHGGRLYLIYPVWRLVDLLATLRAHAIEPKSVCIIYSNRHAPGQLCMVCGVRNGGCELKMDPPFLIYGADGRYSPEMADVFSSVRLPKSH